MLSSAIVAHPPQCSMTCAFWNAFLHTYLQRVVKNLPQTSCQSVHSPLRVCLEHRPAAYSVFYFVSFRNRHACVHSETLEPFWQQQPCMLNVTEIP